MARVLIIDDVPETVRLVALLLQADKHEVVGVDTPARAFALMRVRPFDLVIADHNMPGMTGEALLERVGALWPKTARLMLTADPRVKNDGSHPYPVMHKPFKVTELRAQLGKLLGPGIVSSG